MLYELLERLSSSQVVLDLGCGAGSFHYEKSGGTVVGVDLSFPTTGNPRVNRVRADSSSIPLADRSVDAVISHHTLEHFDNYRRALKEVARVLKPGGWLWIAVPDGYSFEDQVYRTVFSGGGHVNRFRRETLINEVRELVSLNPIRIYDLFSGFVFLKKPTPDQVRFYPRTARFLVDVPDGFLECGVMCLNAGTRIVDRIFGSHCSQYGWGFLFAEHEMPQAEQPEPIFNVCRNCGSGNKQTEIERQRISLFGLQLYRCPHCSVRNVFVPPPPGLV